MAGLVSLVLTEDPLHSRRQVVNRILDGATDKGRQGWDGRYGHGLLNAKCAVKPAGTGC